MDRQDDSIIPPPQNFVWGVKKIAVICTHTSHLFMIPICKIYSNFNLYRAIFTDISQPKVIKDLEFPRSISPPANQNFLRYLKLTIRKTILSSSIFCIRYNMVWYITQKYKTMLFFIQFRQYDFEVFLPFLPIF